MQTFRTKTGHCEITQDKIVLVRTGIRGLFAKIFFSGIAPNEINRSQIIQVEPHPPKTGATRGYFWIHYDDNGIIKKRIIILPGVLGGGNQEFEKAKQILESEGLLGMNHKKADDLT